MNEKKYVAVDGDCAFFGTLEEIQDQMENGGEPISMFDFYRVGEEVEVTLQEKPSLNLKEKYNANT